MTSLIVPAAGKSSRYPNTRPKWMLTHPLGDMMLVKSVTGLNLSGVDAVYVTILAEHQREYKCVDGIKRAFIQAGIDDLLRICVLDHETKHQPQTVAETINYFNITGPIFVKDSDNRFTCNIDGSNCVAVFSLEDAGFINAGNKSYVQVNNMFVTNIAEKHIISPLFCCGGYGFESTDEYMVAYDEIKHKDIYISHVIYKMMMAGHQFGVVKASDYDDWGTLDDWLRYISNFGTVIVDIDGVLVRNSGEYFEPTWGTTEGIEPNIARINELFDSGRYRIILLTSRKYQYRDITEEQLAKYGVKYHDLIMAAPHGRRYIINDYATTNPYPSCVAINIERNGSLTDKL